MTPLGSLVRRNRLASKLPVLDLLFEEIERGIRLSKHVVLVPVGMFTDPPATTRRLEFGILTSPLGRNK
jgi:hypothetical protein